MHISTDEKTATERSLHALHVFPWPKIARYAILASQENMHKHQVVPLNSHTKVVYYVQYYVIVKDLPQGK